MTALIWNHTLCSSMLCSFLFNSPAFRPQKAELPLAPPCRPLLTLKFRLNNRTSPIANGSSLKHLTSGAMHERNNFLLKTKHERVPEEEGQVVERSLPLRTN